MRGLEKGGGAEKRESDPSRKIELRGKHVLVQLCSSLLAHLLQVLATPPRAHGARIVGVKDLVALLQLDARVLARHDDGAAGLAGAHLGAGQGLLGGARGVVAVHGRR